MGDRRGGRGLGHAWGNDVGEREGEGRIKRVLVNCLRERRRVGGPGSGWCKEGKSGSGKII